MKRPKRTFPILSGEELAKLNDTFPCGEFDATFWSAPTVGTISGIRALLDSFRLAGRNIRHVWTTSHDYQHSAAPLENAVFNDLLNRVGLSESDAHAGASMASFDPRARIARCMELDQPFVIEFDSRETFEIDVTNAPEYRISMNRIPRRLLENRFDNVDPEVMFAPVLGRTIASIDLRTFPDGADDETVEAVLFRLDDGNTLKLQGWFDFLEVSLLSPDGHPLTESAIALRQGFFNYEDLHSDPRTGFEAKDATLWFGPKGRSRLGRHAMVLTLSGPSGKRRARAFVDCRDALGLVLGICARRPDALAMREPSDWSAEEWLDVLETGRRLLAGPRLSDNGSPAARLFFEPPCSRGAVWADGSDEEMMERKRKRLLACLDEIRRWLGTDLSSRCRIRVEW